MASRNEYDQLIVFNGRRLSKVIIDQHYKIAHCESINDALILKIIATLDGQSFHAQSVQGEFEFFEIT
jgi:hypothetical protein